MSIHVSTTVLASYSGGVGGGGVLTMGVRNFDLQRSHVRKMRNICLSHFLIYSDLKQRVQRIYIAYLPW